MSLSGRQAQFADMAADLIQEAVRLGFNVTLGEAYRTPEQAALYAQQGKGIVNSLHCKRLAIDLCLFRDGQYLTQTEDYRDLGEWWEAQGGRWGGRFTRPDGNHFELPEG